MISTLAAVKNVLVTFVVFYILVILFGAPFFSDIASTAVLAASLTSISAVPAVVLFDSEERIFEVVVSYLSCDINPTIVEAIPLYTTSFAVLGAWAAASVHPLDWDRWWQRYPLPSITGCFAGAVIGLLACGLGSFFRKRFSSVKTKAR